MVVAAEEVHAASTAAFLLSLHHEAADEDKKRLIASLLYEQPVSNLVGWCSQYTALHQSLQQTTATHTLPRDDLYLLLQLAPSSSLRALDLVAAWLFNAHSHSLAQFCFINRWLRLSGLEAQPQRQRPAAPYHAAPPVNAVDARCSVHRADTRDDGAKRGHGPVRPSITVVVEYLKELASQKNSKKAIAKQPSAVKTATGSSSLLNLEAYIFSELACSIGDFLKKLELLQKAHKLPSDLVVKNYCQVLLSLDHFLRTAVSATSVLQVAKSQVMSLRNNMFHRDIDDLLGFLSVNDADPSNHNWTPDVGGSFLVRSGSKTGGRQLESVNEVGDSSAARDEAVSIMRFETHTLNQRFQQLQLDSVDESGDDAVTQQELSWPIPIHELKYNRDTPIGIGTFDKVYKAKWHSTPVVVKFMGYWADGDEYSRKMFAHELRVWYSLNHPHVIKLYGACHIGKRYFVCNAETIWLKLYEVALGLQYLHEQNIVYNDIKCDNILIGADGDAKTTDFGLSCILNSAEVHVDQKRQGAQQWKSSEYLRGDRLTLASDIYGIRMCILEAVTGRPPWGKISDVFVRNRVKKRMLPARPESMSAQHWSLIEMMCASGPLKRVRVSSIVNKLQEIAEEQQEFVKLFASAP